jgi:hypothetical protein
MLSTNLKRAALALFLTAAGSLPASAQQVTRQIQVVTDPGSAPMIFENIQRSFSPPTPYWIGVEGQPLDAAMRAALDLPEKQGILIARVTAESPASQAGLQAGDILLQWCDAEKKSQPIESVEHLVKLVQETATKQPDQAITLEFRRRCKTETVELKPAKREQTGRTITINQSENIGTNEYAQHQKSALQQKLKLLEKERDAVNEKVQQGLKQVGDSEGKALESAQANLAKAEAQFIQLDAQVRQTAAQLQQFELWSKAMSEHGFSIAGPNGANFDVLIPGPGLMTNPYNPVLPLAQVKGVEWPEDLSVTITRKGNKPAEFVIERGEKKWQATSETINDLPRDIRALLETAEPQKSRMMRLFQTQGNELPGRVELRLPEGDRAPVAPAMPMAPPRVVIHATPQLQQPPALQATQKQIEDLQKALEQLRKQVELMEKK